MFDMMKMMGKFKEAQDKMKEIKLRESIRAEVKNIIKELFKTK